MMGFSAGGHLHGDGRHSFRRGHRRRERSHRPCQLPAGLPDSGLPRDLVRSWRLLTAGRCGTSWARIPIRRLIEDLSNDLRVTPQTPPTFLFHTNADTGVVAENSVRFYLALRRNKVPAELHIFENGPHGVGLALGDPALSEWPGLLTNWLRGRGLTK